MTAVASEEMRALAKALVDAQKTAKALEKSSRAEMQSKKPGSMKITYNYTSAEAIITEARGVLGQHGLAFMPTVYRLEPGNPPTLRCVYRLVHEGGGSVDVESDTPVIEGPGRPRDKATATAKTYDLGYALRGVLLLPRVEPGTEVDARDDADYAPGGRRSSTKGGSPGRPPKDPLFRDETLQAFGPWNVPEAELERFIGARLDEVPADRQSALFNAHGLLERGYSWEEIVSGQAARAEQGARR